MRWEGQRVCEKSQRLISYSTSFSPTIWTESESPLLEEFLLLFLPSTITIFNFETRSCYSSSLPLPVAASADVFAHRWPKRFAEHRRRSTITRKSSSDDDDKLVDARDLSLLQTKRNRRGNRWTSKKDLQKMTKCSKCLPAYLNRNCPRKAIHWPLHSSAKDLQLSSSSSSSLICMNLKKSIPLLWRYLLLASLATVFPFFSPVLLRPKSVTIIARRAWLSSLIVLPLKRSLKTSWADGRQARCGWRVSGTVAKKRPEKKEK